MSHSLPCNFVLIHTTMSREEQTAVLWREEDKNGLPSFSFLYILYGNFLSINTRPKILVSMSSRIKMVDWIFFVPQAHPKPLNSLCLHICRFKGRWVIKRHLIVYPVTVCSRAATCLYILVFWIRSLI